MKWLEKDVFYMTEMVKSLKTRTRAMITLNKDETMDEENI